MDVVGGCCRGCQVNAHNEVGWLVDYGLSEGLLLRVSGEGLSPNPDQSKAEMVTCSASQLRLLYYVIFYFLPFYQFTVCGITVAV
jgi:hypothetical protein